MTEEHLQLLALDAVATIGTMSVHSKEFVANAKEKDTKKDFVKIQILFT